MTVRSKFHPMILLLLSMLLLSCDAVGSVDGDGDPQPQRRELPRELSASETVLAGNSADFGFQFFNELQNREVRKNLFVSPFSISMAFAMAMNGAEGETWNQMRDALGFGGMDMDEINQSYAELIELLVHFDPKVTFSIANSAWYRDTFLVEPDFLERIENFYSAQIQPSDFADPGTVDLINEWVADATEGRIDEVIEMIDPQTILYLINAIYFKGDWTWAFDPDRTKPGPFHREDGETVQVPMMHMNKDPRIAWLQEGNFSMADLPYGDAGFVMTLLLPDEGIALNEVIAGLNGDRWRELVTGMNEQEVRLSMPSFESEYAVPALPSILETLGMVDAFDEILSDFSAINREAGREIFISNASHDTFVSVDETGTEAAAVTTVEFGVTSMPVIQEMTLDRPFLYVIREVESGTILFIGAMMDPS